MSPLLTRVSNSQGISGLSGFRRVFIGRRGVGGYTITRSLRFNSSDSSYLNFVPETAGNRKTWTWSGWLKRGSLSSVQRIFSAYEAGNSAYNYIQWNSDDKIRMYGGSAAATNIIDLQTNAVFRDASAWYHVVIAFDATQSTSSDRVKLYVNGVQQTFSTATYPAQNVDYYINSTFEHRIGDLSGSDYLNGYLADVHFVDGQALAATDFGEFDSTGIWNPKQYTFSTNPNDGITWSDAVSGNALTGYGPTRAFDGDFTTQAIPDRTGTESPSTLTFTPTTTLNGKVGVYFSANTNEDDSATISINGTDVSSTLRSVQSGGGSSPWYYEFDNITSLSSIAWTAETGYDGWNIYGITVGGYLLLDNAKDNSFHLDFSDNSSTVTLGKDVLVEGSAAEVNKGMDVVTYTGNGGIQTINGLRFAPDFVWIKNRNGANNNVLQDSVRGFGSNKNLSCNQTQTEGVDTDGAIIGNTSNGFIVSVNGGVGRGTNTSNYTYVAWCWKAGGPASTNTNGSIYSQVSANQDYGFSIVTFTGNQTAGATVGHGLSSTPKLIILKQRTGSDESWRVHHASVDSTKTLYLNQTLGETSNTEYISGTSSTTFTLSTGGAGVNTNAGYVAYCWSEVSGFSKFGSYTSSTNAEQKITVGFKPRYVLIKGNFGSSDWVIFDTARGMTNHLRANSSAVENDPSGIGDLTVDDTGFTIPATGDNGNIRGGGTYIYAAFAAEPGNNWALNNFVAGTKVYFVNNQGTGLDSYLPGGFTNTQDADSIFTDDQGGIIISAPSGGNWIRMKATSSTATVKWMTYDGSAGGPTITLSQNLDGSGGYITPSTSGNGSSSNPYIGTYSVSSGTSYYIRTNLTGSLNTSMVLYVTGLEGDDGTHQDSLFDSPTIANADDDTGAGGEVSGNYCTWNPLTKGSNSTLSNGNLDIATTDNSGSNRATIGVTSGKWYWEVTVNSGADFHAGLATADASLTQYNGFNAYSWAYNAYNGKLYHNASPVNYGATYTAGDTIGIAFDATNGNLYFYKNGTIQNSGTAAATGLTSGPYFPSFSDGGSGSAASNSSWNFGQRAFAYAAPTGYKPLTTALFDDPTIADGSTAVGIVTYTGNGTSQTISGLGFIPDFAWFKSRSAVQHHVLSDTVRGSDKQLFSNLTNAEQTNSTYVTSFTSDGFSLGSNTGTGGNNINGTTYVAWTWDAGGAPTTDNVAGAGNVPTAGSVKINGANSTTALAGSIAATRLSANTTTGFSIVTYTGGSGEISVGHGLDVAPGFIICRPRNNTSPWAIYHSAIGKDGGLNFSAGAAFSINNYWGTSGVTSTVFGAQNGNINNNGSSYTHIAYCWAPVEGYSAFGSYDGSSSNQFIYTGFLPKYLLIKCYAGSSTQEWIIKDTARNPYNAADYYLMAENDGSEGTGRDCDFLSNGFSIPGGSGPTNYSGRSYVYFAFAEHPLKNARAR